MNVADLDTMEAIRETLAGVSGLRTVRLIRTDESVEVPLSRLPAAVLEPCGTEDVTWPEVPAATYHLVHWHVRVLDRARSWIAPRRDETGTNSRALSMLR